MEDKQSVAPEEPQSKWAVSRRDFLKASGVVLAGLSAGAPLAHAAGADSKKLGSFGMVTDAHFADVAPSGSRYYQDSLAKMTECVEFMNDKKVDYLIELGDFKDQGKPPDEKETLKYLEAIEGTFAQFKGPRYHVLGNHDMDSISKEQFLAHVENTGIERRSGYYSFDSSKLHVIVLDANYQADGSDYDHGNFDWTDTNIPLKELDWLKQDLASTSRPVIVYIHQQLDGQGSHCVNNAADVRLILQESKKVLAVFQGHNHAGHYSLIENIHYYTLKAMVEGAGEENNSYAVVEVSDNYDLVVSGYRRALSREMSYESEPKHS